MAGRIGTCLRAIAHLRFQEHLRVCRIEPDLVESAKSNTRNGLVTRAQAIAGGGIRNVFFTYSMLARVSAMMSFVGESVSRTYQPR